MSHATSVIQQLAWREELGGKGVRTTTQQDQELKHMLKGAEGEWGSDEGTAAYYGRRVFMLSSDLSRCEEHLSVLQVEYARLKEWAVYMVAQVGAARRRILEGMPAARECGEREPGECPLAYAVRKYACDLHGHGHVFYLTLLEKKLSNMLGNSLA